MTEPKTLHHLLLWYRDAWQSEMGTGRIHVAQTDPGGDPDWHARFRALLEGADIFYSDEDGEHVIKGGALRSFPVRSQLRAMAKGGKHGYRRARFLFVLACQDFKPTDAARIVSPAGWDEHGEQWALDYAELCLRRLWRRLHDPERTHEDGRARSFVQRRIGKSEAQAAAEDAA